MDGALLSLAEQPEVTAEREVAQLLCFLSTSSSTQAAKVDTAGLCSGPLPSPVAVRREMTSRFGLTSILSTRIWNLSSFHNKLLHALLSGYHRGGHITLSNLKGRRNCSTKQYSDIPGAPDLRTTKTTF